MLQKSKLESFEAVLSGRAPHAHAGLHVSITVSAFPLDLGPLAVWRCQCRIFQFGSAQTCLCVFGLQHVSAVQLNLPAVS